MPDGTIQPTDVPTVDPSVEVRTGPDAIIREAFAGKVGVLGATEGQDPNSLSTELSDEVLEGLAEAATENELGKMTPEELEAAKARVAGASFDGTRNVWLDAQGTPLTTQEIDAGTGGVGLGLWKRGAEDPNFTFERLPRTTDGATDQSTGPDTDTSDTEKGWFVQQGTPLDAHSQRLVDQYANGGWLTRNPTPSATGEGSLGVKPEKLYPNGPEEHEPTFTRSATPNEGPVVPPTSAH